MANYIDTAFVKIFHDNIIMALQQKGSRLKNIVLNDVLKGEQGFYDVLEKDDNITTLVDDNTSVATRHPDTVISDPEWNRRMISGSFLTKAYLIEQKDRVRMLADPTSRYVQNIAYAMGRKIDHLILNAATGTAYTGKDGTTAVTLPSTQLITADYEVANTAAGLTFDKLMYAKETLDSANVDPAEPRYLILPARQVFALLNDLASTNLTRDADTVRAIAQGNINTYMGFDFVMTNLTNTETGVLLTDGTTTANVDDVIACTKEGILLAINKETQAKINERPDKNYATQIFFGMYAGATRMDEQRVVEIQCKQ